MQVLLLSVNILSALSLVAIVLMQHGRGADMGSSFGRGASGSLVGLTGSSNALSRITSLLATVFFATALSLSFLGSKTGDSLLERIEAEDAGDEILLENTLRDDGAESSDIPGISEPITISDGIPSPKQ